MCLGQRVLLQAHLSHSQTRVQKRRWCTNECDQVHHAVEVVSMEARGLAVIRSHGLVVGTGRHEWRAVVVGRPIDTDIDTEGSFSIDIHGWWLG